jgi:hypothetical protein
MDATYLLAVKEKILATDTRILQKQVRKILRADNPSHARDQLTLLNQIH